MAWNPQPSVNPRYGASIGVAAMSSAQLANYLFSDVALGAHGDRSNDGLMIRLIEGRALDDSDWGDQVWAIIKITGGLGPPPTTPVVAPGSFSFTLPATTNQAVGSMTASAGPITAWAFTAGNSAGFFAIDNSGNITVTSAGAAGLTAQTYALTAQATNAAGNGTGNCTIVVSAAAPLLPVASPASFAFTLPTVNGFAVGTMTATNSPTNWAITAGNTPGWFAINTTGHIRVTSTGATNLVANTYTLVCLPSNASGNGTSANATVSVTLAATGILINGQSSAVAVSLPAADAGAVVGTITVTTNPAGTYVGVITLTGGTDVGKFALSNSGNYPCNLLVGGTAIGAGNYGIQLTATP
jgi:hypothetical protein